MSARFAAAHARGKAVLVCTAPSAPVLLAFNPNLGSACLATQHAVRTFLWSSQQQSPSDKAAKLDEGAAAGEAAPPVPGATIELRPGGWVLPWWEGASAGTHIAP